MVLHEGQRLGGYQILGLLGAGGMGEVYRATDTTLGRVNVDRVLRLEMDDTGPPWAVLRGDVRRRFRQARWKSFRETFARKA